MLGGLPISSSYQKLAKMPCAEISTERRSDYHKFSDSFAAATYVTHASLGQPPLKSISGRSD